MGRSYVFSSRETVMFMIMHSHNFTLSPPLFGSETDLNTTPGRRLEVAGVDEGTQHQPQSRWEEAEGRVSSQECGGTR